MYTPRYVSLTLTFPELPQFEFFFLHYFPIRVHFPITMGMDYFVATAQTLKCNWISHKRRTAVFTSYTQNSIPPRIFLCSPCLKPLRCVVLIDYHAHKVHRDKIMVSKKVTPHANLSSLPWGGGKALSTFISFNSAATHTTVILKPSQCFCYSQFPDTQISFDLWTSFLPNNLSYSIFVDLPSQTLFPFAWDGAFPPNWRIVADIPPDVPHCGAFLPEHYVDVLPV